MLRAGLKLIAKSEKMTGPALVEHVIVEAERRAKAERRRAQRLELEHEKMGKVVAITEQVAASKSLIPDAESMEKVMRYESHLAKQLTQTLHLLERLQAARAGNTVLPPAALDVTVDAGGLRMLPAGVADAVGTG